MRWNNGYGRYGLIFGLLLLTACSSNQPKPEETPDTAATAEAKPPPPPPPPPPRPAVVVPNPSFVPFQKMTVILDETTKQQVAQMADRARSARKIVLIGQCDRKQVANPTDAAIARAVAVRDELLALGVQPSIMQVKIDTRQSNKHAVEIRFD